MDSPVNCVPLRAAIPPNALATKPMPPPAPMRVPPSTTASRTKEFGLNFDAKPEANPAVPAALATEDAPPLNTLPAFFAPPPDIPPRARAVMSSSIPMEDPVCATDKPKLAR